MTTRQTGPMVTGDSLMTGHDLTLDILESDYLIHLLDIYIF